MRATVLVITLVLFALAGTRLHAEDWPMYGRNSSHTFRNNQSLITPFNVSSLTLAWFFPPGDAVSASPTVVNGVVYVGSWDGFFYALDANKGGVPKPIWTFQVDCQYTVLPIPHTACRKGLSRRPAPRPMGESLPLPRP